MPWYRIDAPYVGRIKQHYGIANSAEDVIKRFFKYRQNDLPKSGKIKISIYECARMWTGVDTRDPAKFEEWDIENIFLKR